MNEESRLLFDGAVEKELGAIKSSSSINAPLVFATRLYELTDPDIFIAISVL